MAELHKYASVVIRHNFFNDGMFDAVAVGCDEKPECKGATRMEALQKLEEKIEKMLPVLHADDDPPEIKSNTLHFNWGKV